MSASPLSRPGSRTGLVRSRLVDALAGLRTGRLGLVVAPAGTGKTTVLAHVADRWPGPVGWWSVDQGSTSAENTVRGVWRAICDAYAPLHRTSEGTAPGTIEELLAVLDVREAPDLLLIVDDTHYLIRSPAESTLEELLVHGPPWLHVLVAGRRMPGFNLSRHELSDACLVDGEALRFRSWEVEELLRHVYHEPLPPDDVAALCRRLGGWAAGLHMFHLSTRGRGPTARRRAVAALDGRSELTRAYLARTVLAELPGELPGFLVRTCVFDVLTAERCERLLGGHGTSARLLAELSRLQAFTVTTDGGRTYRYHEALRAHLAVTLTEWLGERGARQWYAKAGELLVAEGAMIEAARAYALAEDWDTARALLDALGVRVADGGVDGWWDLLPSWLVAEDPWLIYAEARQMLSRGRLAAAIDRLRRAEEHLCDEPGLARLRSLRQLASAWLPGPRVPGNRQFDRLREATRAHPALVASAATGYPLVVTAAQLLAGNLSEARRALPPELRAATGDWRTMTGELRALSADVSTPDDQSLAGLGIRLLAGCLAMIPDSRHGCGPAPAGDPGGSPGQAIDAVLADAERVRLPWLVRLARTSRAVAAGQVGLAEAVAVARECDRDGDEWGAVLSLALVALKRSVSDDIRTSDVDEAAELLRRCQRLDAGVLTAWAQALVALAAARAGLPEAELEAQRAEGLARSAGVPGARVAAQAALRRCGTSRADLTALAAACGLPPAVVARWAGAGPHPPARTGEPPSIEVRCFGGFRMQRDGRPVDLSVIKPRNRAALRLLAMHTGRPVHRETMIEAFWPDMPFAAATKSLHVALSSLRTFLEPDAGRGHSSLLVRDGEAYELVLPPDGYSDVAAFHVALDQARRAKSIGDESGMVAALQAVLFAYDGDLLPEDGPAEWVIRERDLLQRQAAEAALELATHQLGRARVADAVAAAERCVQIDRYCDAGWLLLADAYDRLGSRAAATRARQGYAEVLASLDAPLATLDGRPGEAAPPRAGGPGQYRTAVLGVGHPRMNSSSSPMAHS